ncbi:TetR/AcrR family transcriptional regulator C-terminal domain-containing protein [Actinoplanes sp. NPDC026619]|uniref:TetR/AcrR family transcriptional regulator C-terminal domain-containing protein n=1 Tax=Actinoplanes sp. NPDC026619 TaxID=3155798 RepID=UPI0033C32A5D
MPTDSLSRQTIIVAALAIIDSDGVDGLSMRRLGKHLGVDPKAVYYYIPNKAALFDLVIEALYDEMALDQFEFTGSWRADLAAFATRLRDVLRRHPRTLLVFATRPGAATAYAAGAEEALKQLREAGFTPRQALTMISCVRSLTVGLLIAELVEPVGATSDGTIDLRTDYPELTSAISGGFDADEQFRVGLSALLDGFAAPDRSAIRCQ